VCVCVCVCVCACVCVCVCIYIYIVCVCVCVYMNICCHTRTHTHTHTTAHLDRQDAVVTILEHRARFQNCHRIRTKVQACQPTKKGTEKGTQNPCACGKEIPRTLQANFCSLEHASLHSTLSIRNALWHCVSYFISKTGMRLTLTVAPT
jgi:hypothetical protein